eukprot:CAMPEP_0113469502 /NCGR_PEP_ID=MMETSP0014_2-20120614/15934_1 /TAXON_ID=2857 /ORGANISM="Nitzschia sp." /LENGTH=650 /DNA_ID=CAMNT_0000361985 /DNA_START=183 /DNA_END=2135 /DNA_ORIENTATION=+ /assembly_acc=CAM_ASM_000159
MSSITELTEQRRMLLLEAINSTPPQHKQKLLLSRAKGGKWKHNIKGPLFKDHPTLEAMYSMKSIDNAIMDDMNWLEKNNYIPKQEHTIAAGPTGVNMTINSTGLVLGNSNSNSTIGSPTTQMANKMLDAGLSEEALTTFSTNYFSTVTEKRRTETQQARAAAERQLGSNLDKIGKIGGDAHTIKAVYSSSSSTTTTASIDIDSNSNALTDYENDDGGAVDFDDSNVEPYPTPMPNSSSNTSLTDDATSNTSTSTDSGSTTNNPTTNNTSVASSTNNNTSVASVASSTTNNTSIAGSPPLICASFHREESKNHCMMALPFSTTIPSGQVEEMSHPCAACGGFMHRSCTYPPYGDTKYCWFCNETINALSNRTSAAASSTPTGSSSKKKFAFTPLKLPPAPSHRQAPSQAPSRVVPTSSLTTTTTTADDGKPPAIDDNRTGGTEVTGMELLTLADRSNSTSGAGKDDDSSSLCSPMTLTDEELAEIESWEDTSGLEPSSSSVASAATHRACKSILKTSASASQRQERQQQRQIRYDLPGTAIRDPRVLHGPDVGLWFPRAERSKREKENKTKRDEEELADSTFPIEYMLDEEPLNNRQTNTGTEMTAAEATDLWRKTYNKDKINITENTARGGKIANRRTQTTSLTDITNRP